MALCGKTWWSYLWPSWALLVVVALVGGVMLPWLGVKAHWPVIGLTLVVSAVAAVAALVPLLWVMKVNPAVAPMVALAGTAIRLVFACVGGGIGWLLNMDVVALVMWLLVLFLVLLISEAGTAICLFRRERA